MVTAKELNMLRAASAASGGRLVKYDWATPTTESLVRRGWIEIDGPWMYITVDGRDALARVEAGS